MNPKQQYVPLNILLADDDIDDCYFFKSALRELPLFPNLITVNEGEQLMQQLTNEENELPHVLFLDLNMPRKNGFECLSEIKLSEKLRQIPVIIISTSYEQGVVDLLFKSGAQYFIRKPSEFFQLKKIIQLALTLIMQQNTSQPTRENFVLTVQNNLIL